MVIGDKEEHIGEIYTMNITTAVQSPAQKKDTHKKTTNKNEIIKNVFIYDYFKNEKQEEIKIGFRFIFQSKKATLNSAEIELVYNDIITKSLSISGISIPGI